MTRPPLSFLRLLSLFAVFTASLAGAACGDDAPPSCPGALDRCGAECVFVETDPDNCGACGAVCTGGAFCVDGVCADRCDPPGDMCGSMCADLESNPLHCGGCGFSCESGTCISGTCLAVQRDAGGPYIGLGTGDIGEYTPLAEGDDVLLVRGQQGGQHIWVGLRAFGLDTRPALIRLLLERDSDGEIFSLPFQVRLTFQDDVPGGAGYTQISGLALVVTEPTEVLGERVTIRARVSENRTGGMQAETTISGLVVGWDPNNPPGFRPDGSVPDGGLDGGLDSGTDAGSDAAADGGDAGSDATVDSGSADAAPTDAAPDA